MISRKSNSEVETNKDSNKFIAEIKINIGGRLIEADVDESLHIPTVDKLNPANMSNMMAEIPKVHARWNIIYNDAVFEYDILKTKLEVWLARESHKVRKELAKLEKRVTDKMVEDTLKADPEYTKINENVALAKKHMKHIFALANGFGEKGDKLVSIAALMKWEGVNIERGNKGYGKEYKHIKSDMSKNDGWPTKSDD